MSAAHPCMHNSLEKPGIDPGFSTGPALSTPILDQPRPLSHGHHNHNTPSIYIHSPRSSPPKMVRSFLLRAHVLSILPFSVLCFLSPAYTLRPLLCSFAYSIFGSRRSFLCRSLPVPVPVPNPTLANMLASFFWVSLVGLVSFSTAGYVLEDDYSTDQFFSMFDFFTVCMLPPVRPYPI